MTQADPVLLKAGKSLAKSNAYPSAIEFAEALDLSVHDRIESVKAEWLEAEKNAKISVYQRYHWVEAYLKSNSQTRSIQPFIIVGRLNGEIVFILPCQIHGSIVRRLKFIGGSHVNFNLGIFPSKYAHLITPNCFEEIFCRIRRMVPGLGYLALCCQPLTWHGNPNPVLGKGRQRSANPAFLLDLEGGFEATLAKGNAKRKRKKFRQQCRMADERGGYELYKPETASQIEEVVSVFLKQKTQRLGELGIRDVFSDRHVQSFLTDLARKSLGMKMPLLQLYALKIGDEIAAVFGAGSNDKHLSGFFSSIDTTKNTVASPGEMLLYLVVQDACEAGFEMMDLGAGDERYKRSWSTEVTQMYDTFLAFNIFGEPIVLLRRIYGATRRSIRENEKAWTTYKKLRKFLPRLS